MLNFIAKGRYAAPGPAHLAAAPWLIASDIGAALSPFARRLNAVLQSAEHMFEEFPNAGKPTTTENVRVIHF
jgi:hypothetical protein